MSIRLITSTITSVLEANTAGSKTARVLFRPVSVLGSALGREVEIPDWLYHAQRRSCYRGDVEACRFVFGRAFTEAVIVLFWSLLYAVLLYGIYRLIRWWWTGWFVVHLTSWMTWGRDTAKVAAARLALRTSPPVVGAPSVSHTHPEAAASRSAATAHLQLVARLMGRDPYMFQASATDVHRGLSYCRIWYWAKDLAVEQKPFAPPKDAAVIMVDVDYYCNMPKLLAQSGDRPFLLYTIVPRTVGGTSSDASYCFDKRGWLIWDTNGGGHYEHHLWDYSHDALRARDWSIWRWPGDHYYQTERRSVGQGRELVLIVRTAYVPFPANLLYSLDAQKLQRLDPRVGKFAKLRVLEGGEAKISLGPLEVRSSVLMSEAADAQLMTLARTASMPLQAHQIASVLTRDGVQNAMSSGLLLLEHYRDAAEPAKARVCPAYLSRQVSNAPTLLYENAKVPVAPFMSAVVPQAFCPARGEAMERWSVQKRVIDVATAPVVITTKQTQLIKEFAEFIVPTPHRLHPVALEEVYERQNRPSQRTLLAQAAQTILPQRIAETSNKAEAMGEAKPSRLITVINPVDKRDYSCYTYAMAELIKEFPWYAFGKTPAEVATRVAEIAQNSELGVDISDHDKMDGRHGNVCRTMEAEVMVRAFAKEHTGELVELMESQRRLPARGAYGLRYDTGDGRLTGSPETGLLNSVTNAFIVYCALRYKMSPSEAWNAMLRKGFYGGDDGATGDLSIDDHARAAEAVGQKIKAQFIPRGAQGLMFLSRCYGPNVWFGDPNSCADILRAVGKFHLTVNLPAHYSPEKKFLEKAYAYSLTDSQTPILRHLVTKAKRLMARRPELKPEGVFITYAQRETVDRPDTYYPNHGEWMEEYAASQMPGLDERALARWATDDNESPLNPPLVWEPPVQDPPAPALVNGELKPPTDAAVAELNKLDDALVKNEPLAILPQPAKAAAPKAILPPPVLPKAAPGKNPKATGDKKPKKPKKDKKKKLPAAAGAASPGPSASGTAVSL